MSMFPGAGAVIYRNEAGEPIGWDYPSEPEEYGSDPYDDYDHHEEADCFAEELAEMDEDDLYEQHEVADGEVLRLIHRELASRSLTDPCKED